MRPQNRIDLMIAQARQKLNEIKQLQYFGGDSLNLKQHSQIFTIPANDTNYHCWRIVMTPTAIGYTIPIEIKAIPANATSNLRPMLERVQRTDGNFEVLVMFDQSFYDTAQSSEVLFIYSGAATFTVTQIA